MVTKLKNPDIDLFCLTGQEDGFEPGGWYDLPFYEQENNEAPFILVVNIKDKEALDKFADLVDEPQLKAPAKRSTKSIWYPPLEGGERGSNGKYVWVEV
jgi:hypothetical protein